MYLYLLSQNENNDWDTYDSCIVCAESEDEAKNIKPCSNDWGYRFSSWCSSPDKVTVELIGVADSKIEKGIVLSSFNAG